MSRLPTPGSDNGQWGTILNDYLGVEHNADGSQKPLPQSKVINLVSDLAAVQTGTITLIPATSVRNVIQPTATNLTALTLKMRALHSVDIFRIEDSAGNSKLKFGPGGMNQYVMDDPSAPNFLIVKGEATHPNANGGIGVISHNDAHEASLQSLVGAPYGAGPNLFLDTAIGLPATDYWFTQITHKRNHVLKHVQGLESFNATQEHYFFGPIHTDDGLGNITYSYTMATDIATGRTVFNPDVNALPLTYPSLVDIRSSVAALPVLTVTGHSSQSSDALEVKKGATKVSGINAGGAFVSDSAASGIVLKDTQATPHYWRITVGNTGVLSTADLGTTRPTS